MTKSDVLDILEQARMREHFGDDLERMEAGEYFQKALREYRKMYRAQSKWAAKRIMEL